jgi:hypothetical protein
MIAKLAGVAIDARVAARMGDTRSRALAAQWIAKNALAARGVKVEVGASGAGACDTPVDEVALARGSSPRLVVDDFAASSLAAGRWLRIRAETLSGLLAALSVAPALVDASTIPRRWRLALRALGVPMLDRPLADVPARPAGPIALAARPWLANAAACPMYVDATPTGYRVRAAE